MKFTIGDEVITELVDTNVITMTWQKILGVQNLQAPNNFTSYRFEVVHTEKEVANMKKKAEILPLKFCTMSKMKFELDKGLENFLRVEKTPSKPSEYHTRQV